MPTGEALVGEPQRKNANSGARESISVECDADSERMVGILSPRFAFSEI